MSTGKTHVIFDFDGTLADSVGLIYELYNSHTDEFKYLPILESEYDELRELTYGQLMRRKKIRWWRLAKIARTILREMKKRMNEVQPHEGIIELLQKLKDDGYAIGVLTSNEAGLVRQYFDDHNFPDFEFVVSERALFGKHRALKRIMKRHDLKRDQVIYVGDESRDVKASRKAKVKVVGVTWGFAGKKGFSHNQPDRLVITVPGLHAAVEQLTANQE